MPLPVRFRFEACFACNMVGSPIALGEIDCMRNAVARLASASVYHDIVLQCAANR